MHREYELGQSDEATIRIEWVGTGGEPPLIAWIIDYSPFDGGPDPQRAVVQVLSDTYSDEFGYADHYIDHRKWVHDWGASGATEEIVLGITAAFAYDILKASVKAVAGLIRQSKTGVFEARPLTRDEAVERARWKVEAVYSVPGDDLVPREISQIGDEWNVAFRHGDSEYRAKLAIEDEYPSFVELSMRRLD